MAAAVDRLIEGFDRFLQTMTGPSATTRPTPAADGPDGALTPSERRRAAGLMRVDHVGEVCAQALYAGQAAATRNDALRATFVAAGREEADHLAWTGERLRQLGSHRSLLNPAWYAGSFALGWLAGKAGDAISLGFVVETERQVEQHLAGHLESLPAADVASRAIVDAMRADEAAHGEQARQAGAAELPAVVGRAMRGVARVMTTTAYWI